MKQLVLIFIFFISQNSFSIDFNFSHKSYFNPFIIGTGLNYTRNNQGEDALNPSMSWMMKYELNKRFTLKTNFESSFTRNKKEESTFISTQGDIYFGIKTSKEFEISIKTGIHFEDEGKSSISYGIEVEHQSKFLKKLNMSSAYLGVEYIPNLTVGKRRVFSGVRFNL